MTAKQYALVALIAFAVVVATNKIYALRRIAT